MSYEGESPLVDYYGAMSEGRGVLVVSEEGVKNFVCDVALSVIQGVKLATEELGNPNYQNLIVRDANLADLLFKEFSRSSKEDSQDGFPFGTIAPRNWLAAETGSELLVEEKKRSCIAVTLMPTTASYRISSDQVLPSLYLMAWTGKVDAVIEPLKEMAHDDKDLSPETVESLLRILWVGSLMPGGFWHEDLMSEASFRGLENEVRQLADYIDLPNEMASLGMIGNHNGEGTDHAYKVDPVVKLAIQAWMASLKK